MTDIIVRVEVCALQEEVPSHLKAFVMCVRRLIDSSRTPTGTGQTRKDLPDILLHPPTTGEERRAVGFMLRAEVADENLWWIR